MCPRLKSVLLANFFRSHCTQEKEEKVTCVHLIYYLYCFWVFVLSPCCCRLLRHNVSEGLCSASFSFFVRVVLKEEARCIVTCGRRAGCGLGGCLCVHVRGGWVYRIIHRTYSKKIYLIPCSCKGFSSSLNLCHRSQSSVKKGKRKKKNPNRNLKKRGHADKRKCHCQLVTPQIIPAQFLTFQASCARRNEEWKKNKHLF